MAAQPSVYATRHHGEDAAQIVHARQRQRKQLVVVLFSHQDEHASAVTVVRLSLHGVEGGMGDRACASILTDGVGICTPLDVALRVSRKEVCLHILALL